MTVANLAGVPSRNRPDDARAAIRARALDALLAADARFLVGGGYAFSTYTGIRRTTKDLDVFVVRADLDAALDALARVGFRTEVTFPHWLAKALDGPETIDVIFSSGNGIARVDADWFTHAPHAEVLDRPVRLVPPEEMIWSKGYVMERDRFDGADIAHLIRACHDRLDWGRLVDRFGPDHRILLVHLVLFGFVYPDAREVVPRALLERLWARVRREEVPPRSVCRGTLLSRWQYLPDLDGAFLDALLEPRSGLSPREIARWTAEAPPKSR